MISLIYIANIIVAGWIGITSVFYPNKAIISIFEGAYQSTEMTRLVGCLWVSIAGLSALGVWRPITFSPVLMLQLIYKSAWLIIVAVPALIKNQSFPYGMAVFFIVWVLLLPFVIPWKTLFQA